MNKHLTLMAIFIVIAGMYLIAALKNGDAGWMFGFVVGFIFALRYFLKWKESEAKLHD